MYIRETMLMYKISNIISPGIYPNYFRSENSVNNPSVSNKNFLKPKPHTILFENRVFFVLFFCFFFFLVFLLLLFFLF